MPLPNAVTMVFEATPTPKIELPTTIDPEKFGSTAVMFSTPPEIVPVNTASIKPSTLVDMRVRVVGHITAKSAAEGSATRFIWPWITGMPVGRTAFRKLPRAVNMLASVGVTRSTTG